VIFKFRVEGTETNEGTMLRPFEDEYEVAAESAPEALLRLIHRDLWWDTLDIERPFSIELTSIAADPTPDEKVLALLEAHGRRWRNKRSEQSTMVRSVVGGHVYVSDVVTGRSRSLPSASFLRLYESEDDARG
jgi:hypothetical protein